MPLAKYHQLTLNHLKTLASTSRGTQIDFQTAAKNILDILQRSMHFDAAWFLRFDPHSLNILDIHLQKFCQKAFSQYLDVFYTKAPIPTIRQIRSEGFVSKRGSDLIENVTFKESLFFKEVIQPMGLQFSLLGTCVDEERQYVGLIIFWRSKERHDFSVRDCFFLEKASPYCATVLNRSRSTKGGWERPDIVHLVTQRTYPGVLVMGTHDDILFANQEAKSILRIVQSGKAQLSYTDEERFSTKLKQLKSKVLGFLSVTNENGDVAPPCEIFTFRGTTYSCRGIALEGYGQGKGLVMILIETVKEAVNASSDLNGCVAEFTAREGAVAKLIRRGYTNKEIASDMGIGVHTVKDHVKNIMGKLKTNTRSGIVAKIMVG